VLPKRSGNTTAPSQPIAERKIPVLVLFETKPGFIPELDTIAALLSSNNFPPSSPEGA